ncbi:hypothetical protein NUU61_003590 [Penicillium alfredii]|uniref:Uncharacterized protein n=1 Tax=Penicillium alfredii TaxID=1506179 RepID=A0A9W9KD26_9EURO|nr:uncharacterized protein NUU61_003590 [Penicillium alfredii]KAJ5101368.1 hypothetical protein NUU61_003590 [Penicillium alfredii]
MSSNSSCATSKVYEIPTLDASCGALLKGNMSEVMDTCCKQATPTKYQDDCGIYCLAQGQDVNHLQKCLTSKSGNYRDVFCRGNLNATATAKPTGARATSDSTTGTSATSSPTNAAIINQPISKAGLGLIAMVFCSALMGVVA